MRNICYIDFLRYTISFTAQRPGMAINRMCRFWWTIGLFFIFLFDPSSLLPRGKKNYCDLPYKNATIVELNNCELEFIPKSLKRNEQLKLLYLQNNVIQVIDSDLLSNFKHLEGIYLTNNIISEIPNLSSDSLEIIDLSFNKLKGPVDVRKFEGLKNCRTVFLDDGLCEQITEGYSPCEFRCREHSYKPKPSVEQISNPPFTEESSTPIPTLTTPPVPWPSPSPAPSYQTTPNTNEDGLIPTTHLPETLAPTPSQKPVTDIQTTPNANEDGLLPGLSKLDISFLILGAIFFIIAMGIIVYFVWRNTIR